MNKTKIEWTDYTWNPITGCLNGCEYCYARKIYHRFKRSFLPTFHEDRLGELFRLKKPSKVFVCSVSDFWGKGIKRIWRQEVFNQMRGHPEHTFQILTKQPQNITDADDLPKNVLVGVSVTGSKDKYLIETLRLKLFYGNQNRMFVSYEPMIEDLQYDLEGCSWIILGAMTGSLRKKYKPKKEWIKDIVEFGKSLEVPVFMKNSLKQYWPNLIQKFPGN